MLHIQQLDIFVKGMVANTALRLRELRELRHCVREQGAILTEFSGTLLGWDTDYIAPVTNLARTFDVNVQKGDG